MSEKIGEALIEVALDFEKAERQRQRELPDQMGRTGKAAADAMVAALEQRYKLRMARASEKLARGLVNKAEYERAGREAGESFNRGVLRHLDNLRKAGSLTNAQFIGIAGSIKSVSTEATGLGSRLMAVWGSMRGLAAAAVALFVGGRIAQFLRQSKDAALELRTSFLQLQASARLFNIDEADLVEQTKAAQQQFKLSVRDANELTVQTAKLSAAAGDATRSQELMARALDLGAAQGLNAREVGFALEQTLRGLDEGTDKLLQKNPSQVYEEYAASIGKSTEALSNAEQKTALMNAVITAGGKVHGEYQKQLESDVGKLTTWNRMIDAGFQRVGGAFIPILAKLAETLDGPVSKAFDAVGWFLEQLDKGMAQAQATGVTWALQLAEIKLGLLELRQAGAGLPFVPDAIAPGFDAIRSAREERDRLRVAANSELASIFKWQPGRELFKAGPGGGGGGPVDPATLKAIEEAMERLQAQARLMREIQATADRLGIGAGGIPETVVAQLREIVQLEEEIVQLEADMKLLGAAAPSEAKDVLALKRGQLEQLRTEIERSLPGLQEFSVRMERLAGRAGTAFLREDGGLTDTVEALGDVERLTLRVAAAQRELVTARLAGDPERIAAAEKGVADARERLTTFTGGLVRALEAAGIKGTAFEKILEKIVELLQDAGVDVGQLGEQLSRWDKYGQAATVLARGLLSVAEAAGQISTEARRAIGGLLDILDALQQIQNAKQAEGFAKTLGLLSGGAAAIGGVVSLISGVAGLFAPDQDLKDDLRNLTRALRDLEGAILSEVSEVERGVLLREGERIAAAGGKPTDSERFVLERIAELVGVDIETFLTEAGRVRRDQVRNALIGLGDLDLGAFDNSVSGRIQARRFAEGIVGGDVDGEQRFERFLRDMEGVGFESGRRFVENIRKEMLKGGPEAADALIDSWAEIFADPSRRSELLGPGGIFEGLSAEDVKELLEEGNTLLEDWLKGGGAGGVSQDFVQARSITEVTAGRLLGLDTTRNVLLMQIRDLIAGQRGIDAAALSADSLPMFAPETYASMAGPSGSVHVTIGQLMGDVTMNAPGDIVAEAEAAAGAAAMEIVRGVSVQLADDVRARERSLGIYRRHR